MRYVLLIISFIFFTSQSFCASWYVRPIPYGLGNGTSYLNSWGGFGKIRWGTGGVRAGDTLYICGTHIYGKDFNYGQNTIKASGNSKSQITIDGGYSKDKGVIYSARKIKSTGAWIKTNKIYKIKWNYRADFAFESNSLSDEKLLHIAKNITECSKLPGSIYWDSINRFLYLHPYTYLKNTYTDWGGSEDTGFALDVNGQSYITIKNLVLRGGSLNDGVISLVKDTRQYMRKIVIDHNDIGFGAYTGIYWAGYQNMDGLTIKFNKIHHVPTGTYWISIHDKLVNNITITNNELWSGEDIDGIYPATAADRHALGGQFSNNVVISYNNIHDWAGDGIHGWRGGLPNETTNNWTISYNRFSNLNDTNNLYYHRAISLGGANSRTFGDGCVNWKIVSNVIDNCGEGNPEGGGIGIRVKGVMPTNKSFGLPPFISNNEISNCFNSFRLVYVNGSPNEAWTVRNNTSRNLRPGGSHFYIEPSVKSADLSGIIMYNNIYLP